MAAGTARASGPGEVAARYRYRDGGEIGVIASVTQPFCRGCTRARLSVGGKLSTRLFAGTEHDLRGLLRAGASDQAPREHVAGIWTRRADRYSERRTRQTSRDKVSRKAAMSHIGGWQDAQPADQTRRPTARHALMSR